MFTVLAIFGATALYTIISGLLAVVIREAIQIVIVLLGFVCMTFVGFWMTLGWERLRANVHLISLAIIRLASEPMGVEWEAVFLGYPVLGMW
jgi:SSS family solute:Na+ symporter